MQDARTCVTNYGRVSTDNGQRRNGDCSDRNLPNLVAIFNMLILLEHWLSPPPHATRSVVTWETNLKDLWNFCPFMFYLPRITVKPFPSSQPPFEQFCYIFYTSVLFKKWKILGTMSLVSNHFKRLDHIFYNHPGMSFNLMINVHLISSIPVLTLQSRVYYTRTTVVQFPLNLYLFWCFAKRALVES